MQINKTKSNNLLWFYIKQSEFKLKAIIFSPFFLLLMYNRMCDLIKYLDYKIDLATILALKYEGLAEY